MSTENLSIGTRTPSATSKESLQAFLERIQSVPADANDTAPWNGARHLGAAAVPGLCQLLSSNEFEIARNAKRALYDLIHEASRPGAKKQMRQVEAALLTALQQPGTRARSQILWTLSEIGSRQCVPEIARWLKDKTLREEARCALERLPGRRATAVLKDEFKTAEADFKPALAASIRVRGG